MAVAIGVDADPDMIAAAKTAAERAGATNVDWRCMRAEELPADLGRFAVVTSTPHLFGDDVGRFEADLRALLHDTAPDSRFSERTRDIALEIWR